MCDGGGPGLLDCTYRVQVPHRTGQLARVMQAIADADALIGDVQTVSIGREHLIREITVEVRDNAHSEEVAESVNKLGDIRVVWYQDRAMIRHEGGKLSIEAI